MTDPRTPPKKSLLRKFAKWGAIGGVLVLVLALGAGSLFGDGYVWVVTSEEGTYLVIFEAFEVTKIPDDAPALGLCVGIPTFSITSFSLGWRAFFESARVIDEPGAGGEVIEVTMTHGGKQYYAPCGGRLSLIRLEDGSGQSWKNIYHAPNITIGPRPPHGSEKEWEEALLSGSKPEILRTLVWLGGVHLDVSKKPQEYVHHEDLDEAYLWEVILLRPKVKTRLKELSESPDPWIQEAAESALKPYRSDPYM